MNSHKAKITPKRRQAYRKVDPRKPMRPNFMLRLPNEVLMQIVEYLTPPSMSTRATFRMAEQQRNMTRDIASITTTCRHLNKIATPILYARISILEQPARPFGASRPLLIRTLNQQPSLGDFCKKLHIEATFFSADRSVMLESTPRGAVQQVHTEAYATVCNIPKCVLRLKNVRELSLDFDFALPEADVTVPMEFCHFFDIFFGRNMPQLQRTDVSVHDRHQSQMPHGVGLRDIWEVLPEHMNVVRLSTIPAGHRELLVNKLQSEEATSLIKFDSLALDAVDIPASVGILSVWPQHISELQITDLSESNPMGLVELINNLHPLRDSLRSLKN